MQEILVRINVVKNNREVLKDLILPIVLTLSCACTFITYQSCFSPVVEALQQANSLSRFLATIIMSSPSFFVVILSFFAGRLLDRVNPIKVSTACFLFVIVLSLSGIFIHGFWSILIIRLISGVPFAFLLVIAFQLPQTVYPSNLINRMVTIQTLGVPAGSIVVVILGALIGESLGYTYTYLVPIGFSILGLTTSLFLYDLRLNRRVSKFKVNRKVKRITISLAFAWMLFSGSTSIFLLLGVELGKSLGLPLMIAVLGPVFLMAPTFIMSVLSGELMDKKASRYFLIILPTIIMIISLSILWIGIVPWIIGAVLLGLSSAIIPPVILSTPSRFEKPENTGTAIGLLNMFGTFGVLVIPPIAGLLNDISASWWLPMVFASTLVFGIIAIVYLNKRSLS